MYSSKSVSFSTTIDEILSSVSLNGKSSLRQQLPAITSWFLVRQCGLMMGWEGMLVLAANV